jgi:hypothetical protein
VIVRWVKMPRSILLVVIATAVLSLAACGGGAQQASTPPEGDANTSAEVSEETGSVGEGSSSTDTQPTEQSTEGFTVTTLDGEQFDLSGGQEGVVALFFMAGY